MTFEKSSCFLKNKNIVSTACSNLSKLENLSFLLMPSCFFLLSHSLDLFGVRALAVQAGGLTILMLMATAAASLCYFFYKQIIAQENVKQFVLITSLFFLVSFNYNLLRALKATNLVYAPGAGAEVMPFLKPFVIMPGAFLLTWYYLYLAKHFNRDQVFKIIVGTFFSYFVLYTFVLYPYQEAFALDNAANFVLKIFGANMKGLAAIVRYWMHTIFYAFAELWGTTVLSLLMWGLVNEISTPNQAKATYALFSVGSNSSGIFAGQLSKYLSKLKFNSAIPYGETAWDQAFFRIMIVSLIIMTSILVTYHYLSSLGLTKKANENMDHSAIKNKSATGSSLIDSFYQVLRSPQLLFITTIVLGYNLVYNISDVAFNKQVELSFGANFKADSNAFVSQTITYTAMISTFFALFVTNLSLRYLGWTFTALITPIAYLMTGFLFYGAQLVPSMSESMGAYLNFEPSLLLVNLGALHYCVTRGSKYSVFDATKEMSYITLTREERVYGKAAIDGIGSRFGKAGGSVIYVTLFALLGQDIRLAIPYVFLCVLLITTFWIVSVVRLGSFRGKTYQLRG